MVGVFFSACNIAHEGLDIGHKIRPFLLSEFFPCCGPCITLFELNAVVGFKRQPSSCGCVDDDLK